MLKLPSTSPRPEVHRSAAHGWRPELQAATAERRRRLLTVDSQAALSAGGICHHRDVRDDETRPGSPVPVPGGPLGRRRPYVDRHGLPSWFVADSRCPRLIGGVRRHKGLREIEPRLRHLVTSLSYSRRSSPIRNCAGRRSSVAEQSGCTVQLQRGEHLHKTPPTPSYFPVMCIEPESESPAILADQELPYVSRPSLDGDWRRYDRFALRSLDLPLIYRSVSCVLGKL
jgi:hypothetical protein